VRRVYLLRIYIAASERLAASPSLTNTVVSLGNPALSKQQIITYLESSLASQVRFDFSIIKE
jgi:hypothetical protein